MRIICKSRLIISNFSLVSHDRNNTLNLLKQELEVNLSELQEKWHFASLERIFIENRIYHKIEELDNWKEIIATIHKELKPHTKHLLRDVTDEDVERLTEIKIKKITKFDLNKANEELHVQYPRCTGQQASNNLFFCCQKVKTYDQANKILKNTRRSQQKCPKYQFL